MFEAVALYESTLEKYNKLASGLAFGIRTEMQASMARGRSFMVVSSDIDSFLGAGLPELGHIRQHHLTMDYSKFHKALQIR